MRAIILAAGCGKRMGHLTANYPKAMLPVSGRPMIEWQIDMINQSGISQIAIVKGYKGEVFDYPVKYFSNSLWNETNMVSTLLCAREWLVEDTCIVSYSDILYSSKAVNELIKCDGDIAITYDPSWRNLWNLRFSNPLDDAENFQFQGNNLLDIGGKADSVEKIQGQYMGLLKFTKKGWMKVDEILRNLTQDQINKMDMTKLLKKLLNANYSIKIAAANFPWCEVDNESDYILSEKIIKELI